VATEEVGDAVAGDAPCGGGDGEESPADGLDGDVPVFSLDSAGVFGIAGDAGGGEVADCVVAVRRNRKGKGAGAFGHEEPEGNPDVGFGLQAAFLAAVVTQVFGFGEVGSGRVVV